MECILTDANFKTEVLQADLPVLVDFYADWCVPCKMMAPIVKEMAEKYGGKVKVGKMNIEENPDTTTEYGIMSIPTFILFQNGKKFRLLQVPFQKMNWTLYCKIYNK